MNSKISKKILSKCIDILPNYLVKKLICNIKPEKITNPNYYFELSSYSEVLLSLKKPLNLKNSELIQFFLDSINVFSEEKYDKKAYVKIRNWSIKSGFELTNLLKNLYRDYFANKNRNDKNNIIYDCLMKNGYYKINATQISTKFVEKINLKLSNAKVMREKDGEKGNLKDLLKNPIPGGFRYFYKEEAIPLVECIEVLTKLKIIDSIESYLGKPILRCVNAWISMPSDKYNDSDIDISAQAFHNDMDIPSGWIKVFIYLSDVDNTNGPHIYIPKSHKRLSEKFREDRRFRDDEIEKEYSKPIELTGPAGTIIIADTIGFHKGKTVTCGMRSILQLEFSTSLIGAETLPVEFEYENNIKEIILKNTRLMHRYTKML